MKILFCTKNDLFGALILNWLLPKLHGHQVAVFLSDKTRPAENDVIELADEKFFERDLPLGIVFPRLDRQGEYGNLLTFKALSAKYGIGISTVNTINSTEMEASIRKWAPDIIVSARFSLIFKQNILQIPRFGAYNIHPGTLPGYAGLCAPFRALLNQDETLGCTLHQIDLGIDTGPIHSVSKLQANPNKSVFWHIGELYPLGLAKLIELLDELDQGKAPQLQKQETTSFRYYKLPATPDFHRFRSLGLRAVDLEEYGTLLGKFSPDRQLDWISATLSAERQARAA
ncbi:MAG: formyltransferase family protein [Pseudomonadota bacterium]